MPLGLGGPGGREGAGVMTSSGGRNAGESGGATGFAAGVGGALTTTSAMVVKPGEWTAGSAGAPKRLTKAEAASDSSSAEGTPRWAVVAGDGVTGSASRAVAR